MSLDSFDPKDMLAAHFERDGADFLYYPDSTGIGVRVTGQERDFYLSAPPLEAMALHKTFAQRKREGKKRSRKQARQSFDRAEPLVFAIARLAMALFLVSLAFASTTWLWSAFFAAGAAYLAFRVLAVLRATGLPPRAGYDA